MLTNSQRQAVMYIGIGAFITLLVLSLMGRLRMERYEEPASDAELKKLLGELAQDTPVESVQTATGPAPMGGDSDSDSDSE